MVMTITSILMLSSVIAVMAHSGNWSSGQQYDLNGLNSCHSTQLESSSKSFTATVYDEYSALLGTTTRYLGQNGYIELKNAGGIGSKECNIYTSSTNHLPGFNS